MKKIKVISCMITVAVMVLIFFFSSQTASESSGVSRGVVKKIVDVVTNIVGQKEAKPLQDVLHSIVRKFAHFSLFFLLGISVSNTGFQVFAWKGKKLVTIALSFCLFYALTDEFHQMFVPGRAMMLNDVIIDFIGSVFGCALFMLAYNLYLRRRGNGM